MSLIPLRFPVDLTDDANRIPYVKFSMIKYRERNFIFEKGTIDGISSEVTNIGNVILPLPESVSNSTSLNWEMTNLQGVKLLEGILAGKTGMSGAAGSISDVQAIFVPQISKIAQQQTPNPKKQALFNGIDPRSFTFTYLFAPQSLREAEQLERVIRLLTVNSLPELIDYTFSEDEELKPNQLGPERPDINSAFYKFPAEFNISFFNVAGFPRLRTCVCTNISTNYSPVTMQLLESGHSVQVALSLSFLETELLRRSEPGV